MALGVSTVALWCSWSRNNLTFILSTEWVKALFDTLLRHVDAWLQPTLSFICVDVVYHASAYAVRFYRILNFWFRSVNLQGRQREKWWKHLILNLVSDYTEFIRLLRYKVCTKVMQWNCDVFQCHTVYTLWLEGCRPFMRVLSHTWSKSKKGSVEDRVTC